MNTYLFPQKHLIHQTTFVWRTMASFLYVISGFSYDVDEICPLLGCYNVYTANSLHRFREKLQVPSSGNKYINWPLKKRRKCCPETSLSNYHSYLLIPCNSVLFEELTGSHLVKKFPVFYGTPISITPSTSVCLLSLSRTISIQFMSMNRLPEDTSLYYPPIYAWFFQVASFP